MPAWHSARGGIKWSTHTRHSSSSEEGSPGRRRPRRSARGLHRPGDPDRRRARPPLRAPAAVQGLPARARRSATASSSTSPPGTREHDVELHLGQTVVALDRAAKTVTPRRRHRRSTTTSCCWPPAPSRAAWTSPAPTWPASTTCAGSPTPSGCKDVLTALGRDNGHLVIAGAGWIGLEVAAAARGYGAEVTVVEPRADPAARGPRPRARRSSSPTCTASTASASTSAPGSPRSPARTAWCWPPAPTTARSTPPTTCSPRSAPPRAPRSPRPPGLEMADRAAGRRHRGRRLAAHLRPGHLRGRRRRRPSEHPLLGARLRVEHWANALNGGPAAARAMLGQEVVVRPGARTSSPTSTTWAWSTPGYAPPGSYDQVVFRGDVGQAAVHRLLAEATAGCWPG